MMRVCVEEAIEWTPGLFYQSVREHQPTDATVIATVSLDSLTAAITPPTPLQLDDHRCHESQDRNRETGCLGLVID